MYAEQYNNITSWRVMGTAGASRVHRRAADGSIRTSKRALETSRIILLRLRRGKSSDVCRGASVYGRDFGGWGGGVRC